MTSSFSVPIFHISCHWQVPQEKKRGESAETVTLALWFEKVNSRRDFPSAISYSLFLARARVVLWQLHQKQTGNRAHSVLPAMLGKMWRCEFSGPLPSFLRRKVRRRAFILEYFCSDVNSLCLSPNLPISPRCLNPTLNFFCNSLSTRWLTHPFSNQLGLLLSPLNSLEGLRWVPPYNKSFMKFSLTELVRVKAIFLFF